MKTTWVLVSVLLLGLSGLACAEPVVTDRSNLRNPDTAMAPYGNPEGYAVAPAAAPTVQTRERIVTTGDRDGNFPDCERREVPVTDRDHLWNPFVGEVPWHDPPIIHKYAPRQ